MKPGYKTTEFYLTLLKGLVGPALAIGVASGKLTPDSVSEDAVVAAIEKASAGIIALVGLVMSGLAVKTYTESRTAAKSEAEPTLYTGEMFPEIDMEEEDDDDE